MVHETPPKMKILPRAPVKREDRSSGRSDRKMAERLGRLYASVASDRPLSETLTQALADMSALFGISEIIFEIRVEEIWPDHRWFTYGVPEQRAVGIVENLSAAYYPKALLDKTLTDKFRISRSCYYIPGDELLKIVSEDPFGDHPSHYRHPEDIRAPRKRKDEWHEADEYRFTARADDGPILAVLDMYYSDDEVLLDQETVESIELFVQMTAIVIEREMSRRGHSGLHARVAQRTDLLEDILRIASSIVSERDVKKLSEMILTSVSSLFGFQRVSLAVYDETEAMFKWMAMFGYSDEIAQDAKVRMIPTDVVMEDLKESRRIGRSVYLTLVEEVGPRSRAYFDVPAARSETVSEPRRKDEFRKGDYLAFVLHDSSGRIVGVIYPSEPRSGRLPDKEAIETIEIFTSLAEVALENARLSQEREQALRLSSQRTEQLSRILDHISGTMYVRNLDQMLENLLKTLARLVGIKRMVIGVKSPELGVYKVEAVHGYSPKAAEAIKRHPYPYASIDSIMELTPTKHPDSSIKWRHKVGRMTYYMPAEGQQSISPEEMPYYPEPELIRMPRPGKGRWHELDWMDTVIADKDGIPIAYLEILRPRDDRIPDSDTIEIVEIFAGLAGIAIENAKMLQEHIDSRRDAELYTDVLSHDIKNFNQAILGYLELLKHRLERSDNQALLDKIAEQVMNTSWLASNVRTMSRVTFGDVDLSRTDLGQVLSDCEKSLTQYYPGRKIACSIHVGRGPVIIQADDLVRELFVNILTNAVKYDSHETVEIDITVETVIEDTRRSWLVAISDHGCGVPDDAKPMIFDRFTKAPTKKGSGMGLHIVKTLATRYRGKVWIEDRVKGDHTQGAIFKVELPSVE